MFSRQIQIDISKILIIFLIIYSLIPLVDQKVLIVTSSSHHHNPPKLIRTFKNFHSE